MLSKKAVSELLTHLEKAQNPVFLYDNDADGLCSYILLRKFLGRGKGVALRTYPEIDIGYAKKVQELGADYVFILDKPFLGRDFLSELENTKIPLVWIDHHLVERKQYEYSNLYVYNSADKSGKAEPVTALCYQLTQQQESMWIAMMGCIADHFWPSFTRSFAEVYPKLWTKTSKKDPFAIYYSSEIGRLARAQYRLKSFHNFLVQL
jgi:single-stranded DNA-specific DHH superfamily exonuclease